MNTINRFIAVLIFSVVLASTSFAAEQSKLIDSQGNVLTGADGEALTAGGEPLTVGAPKSTHGDIEKALTDESTGNVLVDEKGQVLIDETGKPLTSK